MRSLIRVFGVRGAGRFVVVGVATALMACGGEREVRDADGAEPAAQNEISEGALGDEAVSERPALHYGQPEAGTTSGSPPPAPSSDADRTASGSALDVEPMRAIPEGTLLGFHVIESVSTSSQAVGDRFDLRLVDPARGPDGAYLPAGTRAVGVVTQAQRSSSSEEEALLSVEVREVEVNGTLHPIRGVVESASVEGATQDSGARSAAKVATGAAAGAVLGRILGGDSRAAVQGAAVGTVAGAGVAITTRDGHATLARGSRLTVRLEEPLILN